MKPETIDQYHDAQASEDQQICALLRQEIDRAFPDAESKIWHGHPVWFLDGNPITGYSKLKDSVRLLFWSGQSFETGGLSVEGKFKAAEKRYTSSSEIDTVELRGWLGEARDIQSDYKNLVKRKGRLERLK
ncbi:DUF1801 domain-containing protein [Parvularcula marina]|uniref:DUF1801 domain-containing protein n=1 Tax=Parvularcula marina TaxID=2292771 RepID=A0A371RIM0_9PROT|nr:DUF1801 domain-containing protein [Parvularcula marina]RFB05299.1 DUF1801 domain-containing protein [Parvularcula marina]